MRFRSHHAHRFCLGAQAGTPTSKLIIYVSIVLTMLISWAMLRGAAMMKNGYSPAAFLLR